MRFKLVLNVKKGQLFPFNYQYELSAGLYKIFMHIKNSYPKYAVMDNGEFLNHITFSRIEIPKREIEKEGIRSLSSIVFLKISLGFPDINSHILEKAFRRAGNSIFICKKSLDGPPVLIKMFLKDIEFVPSPEFEETMKMKMLSPLVLTKKIQNKKKYLSFQEKSEIIHRLQENLVQKFEQLHNKVPDIDSFKLKFDEEYCENREEKDLYSLIRMKEAGRNPFVVMGFLIPFTLEAPSELIQVGYYSGFGEKTSLGFGMAEVISTPTRIMEPRAKEEVKILSI